MSDSYLPSPLPKQNFYILGGRLIGLKTIEKPLSERPKGDRERLIEVAG